MKTCTFKQAASLLLCCLITTASAKEIYLSSNGKDKNDGTTPATAVKPSQKLYRLQIKATKSKYRDLSIFLKSRLLINTETDATT